MHDGSAVTLDAAFGRHSMQVPAIATFTDGQIAALREFLGSLTDIRFISDPRFSYPAKACGRTL